MSKDAVKATDLKRSLLEERKRFASWDNGRRNKVDIVVEAINRNEENANLDKLQDTVVEVANEREHLKELEGSAVKMLRIHYLNLSRTDNEKKDYLERRKRALSKIKRYEEKHHVRL